MIFRKLPIAGLLIAAVVASTVPASAALPLLGKKKLKEDVLPTRKLTASQNALIDKAIVREKEVIKQIKDRSPLVETYIQNMRPDPILGQVPDSDQHFLGRVEFNKIIGDNAYQVNDATSKGTSKDGKLGFLKHSL